MSESTKYLILKNQLKAWIMEGKIQAGQKIYSENELVKMFGYSRHTVRLAVGELVHEGWLYREQGSGTFCAQRTNPKAISNSKNIGVITTYISNYIFPSIIRGIESYLSSRGYSLIMASTDNDIEKEKLCLNNMLSRGIDGLIVEPTKSSSSNPNINYYLNLEQNHTPYLMINQYYSELNPPHLIVDDELGGFLATEHLINYGHRKIIGIFKSDDMQGVNRMKGFISAFRSNGLPFFSDTVITYSTESVEEDIKSNLKRILTSSARPSAIVCYNDEIALKVLHLLRELDLRVPEDISIVGNDDSHLASEIKLTSLTHPKAEMGEDAAKWIIAKIEGRNTDHPASKIYKPELVIRSSTKELNSHKVNIN